MIVKRIGYWAVTEGPQEVLGYPHPDTMVDPSWEPARRQRIAEYLSQGRELAAYMGFAPCRFAGCRRALGTRDLTDGCWMWPEGLEHYVLEHAVFLPPEFVEDVTGRGFVMPSPALQPVEVDSVFWLRWAAANTPPPAAMPGACPIDQARATCEALRTGHWHALLEEACGRWKLEIWRDGATFEDYTGPLTDRSLRRHLFRSRRPDDAALLNAKQAWDMAAQFDKGLRKARPFGQMNASDGIVWWALISAEGAEPPTTRFEDIDLRAIEPPQPGWATFRPDGWRVEAHPAMDEPAWRFYLEEWADR